MKAVIAGGGIGGLCAALCFHKFGWEVEVLEQATAITEVGAGIQLSPNAVKVLRAIGVADQVGEQAFTPLAGQFRSGKSGKVIGSFMMGESMEKRLGAPYWHIHRADLIAALEAAVRDRLPGAIRTGASVTGYDQDAASARANLETGERITGDILVGADGIKSAIRTQMLGEAKPRFTGNVAWRAVVPVSKLGRHAPPPTASVWVGEGRHAVTYLLRKGTLANLVGVVERDDWTVESWTEQGTKQEALRDFAGWHPTIRKIIDEADAHFRWALFDRNPLDQWCDGRVALLGDACHPMLPFMAQGAAMAIEDGYTLASELSGELSGERGLDAALADYFTLRRTRTAKVQMAARSNMGTFHQRSFRGKFKTYAPIWLASRIAPDKMDEQNDWLYGYDATA
ncbi:MAG: FAD-dependent monooxygenase [Pseudomonadota bacterium]